MTKTATHKVSCKNYCVVNKCTSGRVTDKREKKILGIKNTSIFKVPKCPIRRQQWNAALGQILTETDSVCERHFQDADIIKADEIIINGVKVISPRLRPCLRKTAVPIFSEYTAIKQIPTIPISEQYNIMRNENSSQEINMSLIEIQHSSISEDKNESTAPLDRTMNNLSVLSSIENFFNVIPRSSTPIMSETQEISEGVRSIEENFPDTFDDLLLFETETANKNTDAINNIKEYFIRNPLRQNWAWIHDNFNSLTFVYLKNRTEVSLYATCDSDLNIKVFTHQDTTISNLKKKITSPSEIISTLTEIENLKICQGTGIEDETFSLKCLTAIPFDTDYKINLRFNRCHFCRERRKEILKSRRRKTETDLQESYDDLKKQMNQITKQFNLFRKKNEALKDAYEKLKDQAASLEGKLLTESVSKLPELQKKVVNMVFDSATINSKQRRYDLDYIYECLLMRIKSSKLYDHIRESKMLPLPCRKTLDSYIQKLDSAYGFQKSVFESLHKRSSHMTLADRRGTLLVDEMSLSEAIALDKKNMKMQGFVDLGQYTPDSQKCERGDHALVFMFQPFRGKWVQVLGCFLSKHSATSQILHKLIIECIVMLGVAGFHVDAVTMDGAAWNRGVWNILDIDENHVSCQHPFDPSKKLWFTSDFPHLLKCFRNKIMEFETFLTPDGLVKKTHWSSLLEYENYPRANLRIAHQLTPNHINPTGYQKMNVPMAYQLFSNSVSAAMEILKDMPNLVDASPTIAFIKRINKLIEVMTSRVPKTALRANKDCQNKKFLQEFLVYLDAWQSLYKLKKNFPVTSSTFNGLKVTLKATLELIDYLHEECDYNYLLTVKLTQDALEKFFGIVRNACGSNDHPDPILFAKVFRLLCCYSLIKPPKNCNIGNTELLQPLMKTKDSETAENVTKQKWQEKLELIIEAGIQNENDEDGDGNTNSAIAHLSSHDYDTPATHEAVLQYIGGYVTRIGNRFTKCVECRKSLKSDKCEVNYKLIEILDKGGLIYPSPQLVKLLTTLEGTLLQVVGKLGMHVDTLFYIIDEVERTIKNITFVGCKEHSKSLTKQIINFYIVSRGHFLCKSFNAKNNEKAQKTKRLRKQSKL